jgi:hypothetical protein
MGKPDTPDYEAAAEATAASDERMLDKQTSANRPNRNNPWGSETWEQDADGNWTQNTTLNDTSQQALDSELNIMREKNQLGESMMGRMGEEFGEKMEWGQFGDAQSLEFNPDEIRQQAQDAAYDRSSGRLDSRFDQSDNELEVSLRNRGLSEGDAAFDSAMANQSDSKNDAYANAQNDAVGQGRAESAQAFDQQKQSTDYANNLRQSQMSEEMKKRGFSLNEINAIISGQQVAPPEFNSFNQAQKGQGVDYSGATKAGFNADMAKSQQLMDGVTGVAGAAGGMFCDRRLKTNIKRIGEFLGFPFYSFTYVWGEVAAGVMADEVNSAAVSVHSSGYSMVDYSKLNAGEL